MTRPYRVFLPNALAAVATFSVAGHAHRYARWLSAESGVAIRVVLVSETGVETNYYAGDTANPLVGMDDNAGCDRCGTADRAPGSRYCSQCEDESEAERLFVEGGAP